MQAPLIDKRSYADLVAQTTQLAGQFSGWQPPSGGQPDPGLALIGVFGRFAELLIERLNRAPDKNYLAFLNLIGASPLPPRAARVPLTRDADYRRRRRWLGRYFVRWWVAGS